jgi:hypothetical protein
MRRRAPALLHHFVRAQQNRWGHGKAKRRGGLAVHNHLKLGRELHWEIAQLLAAQTAIGIPIWYIILKCSLTSAHIDGHRP